MPRLSAVVPPRTTRARHPAPVVARGRPDEQGDRHHARYLRVDGARAPERYLPRARREIEVARVSRELGQQWGCVEPYFTGRSGLSSRGLVLQGPKCWCDLLRYSFGDVLNSSLLVLQRDWGCAITEQARAALRSLDVALGSPGARARKCGATRTRRVPRTLARQPYQAISSLRPESSCGYVDSRTSNCAG